MTGQAVSGVYGYACKPVSGARATQMGLSRRQDRRWVWGQAALMGPCKAELLS